jgi:hypothetical protein
MLGLPGKVDGACGGKAELPEYKRSTSNAERPISNTVAFDVGCWTFGVVFRLKEGWLSPV